MSGDTYNLLSIIILAATAITTIVALIIGCVQIWQIANNRKKQYDYSRREKTVEMVKLYTETIHNSHWNTRAIEKIVSEFTDYQCQELYNLNEFSVDKSVIDNMCKICPYRDKCNNKKEKCKKENKYYITGDMLIMLRTSVIDYLNLLETILLSWQLGIVEQNALGEEFTFLDKKRKKERALEIFRTIAGNGNSYPAIEKYYQYLDQHKQKQAQETIKQIIK